MNARGARHLFLTGPCLALALTMGTAQAQPRMDAVAATDAMNTSIAERIDAALQERLPTPHRFELVQVDSLELQSDCARVLAWGMLHEPGQSPALLRVELELERDDLSVRHLDVRAHSRLDVDEALTQRFTTGAAGDELAALSP